MKSERINVKIILLAALALFEANAMCQCSSGINETFVVVNSASGNRYYNLRFSSSNPTRYNNGYVGQYQVCETSTANINVLSGLAVGNYYREAYSTKKDYQYCGTGTWMQVTTARRSTNFLPI